MMKFVGKSLTSKDHCRWVRVGRQMVQEHGGLVPSALRARPLQAVLGVILILVCPTFFLGLLTISETMSLKVRIGLTFNQPSRLSQPINLRHEADTNDGDSDAQLEHHRHLGRAWSWSSIPGKDFKNILQQQLIKESWNANYSHGIAKKRKVKNRARLTNGPSLNDLSARRGQQDDVIHSSKGAAGGDIGLDDRVRNVTLHDVKSPTVSNSDNPTWESRRLKRVVNPAEERPAEWLQFPNSYADGDETEHLMLPIRRNGSQPCHNVRTKTALVHGLPPSSNSQEGEGVIQLVAGPVFEVTIVSIGDDDQPRCAGGDYYETDLSGPLWKSRPPVVDLNNGTYSVHIQMDPRFAGRYTFTVVLLFANYHALHFHPQKYARMENIATFELEFMVRDAVHIRKSPSKSEDGSESSDTSNTPPAHHPHGPALPICSGEDFRKKHWSGRWTREQFHEDCEYDRLGRWQCVNTTLPCQKPWCEGAVGSLESNGWVYSAHCAFKIFQTEEAWKCLDGKWLFFWGDSNHIDTIRNLLNFVLGFQSEIKFLDRRMDRTFSSPPDNRSTVRITSMFNGHSNVSRNYEGLFSLHNPEFAAQLRGFFTGETAPDVMIMNSGLHDGLYWRNMEAFLRDGVEYAADFWSEVWKNMTARRPDVLYRTTVATGGQSRNLSFNPHKMELFNHIIVDRLLKLELERFQIIDGFDYTFPWHWDHKTNDGVHYGRPPSKTKWVGNNVGHRYFVDLMLVHMLLNAICKQ